MRWYKFLDIIDKKSDIKSDEWITVNGCFFHSGHPMVITIEEDNKILVRCIYHDSYIEIENKKISGVISENTSFLKDSVLFAKAEEYINKLRVININDLRDCFERCYNDAVSSMEISPFSFELENIEVRHNAVILNVILTDDNITKEITLKYPLVWGSRGMYVKPLKYYDKYDVPFRQLFVISKYFEERLTKVITSDLVRVFDRFTCEIEEVINENIVGDYVVQLEQKLDTKFRYRGYGMIYETTINDIILEVRFAVNKSNPFIQYIYLYNNSGRDILTEDVLSEIVKMLKT